MLTLRLCSPSFLSSTHHVQIIFYVPVPIITLEYLILSTCPHPVSYLLSPSWMWLDLNGGPWWIALRSLFSTTMTASPSPISHFNWESKKAPVVLYNVFHAPKHETTSSMPKEVVGDNPVSVYVSLGGGGWGRRVVLYGMAATDVYAERYTSPPSGPPWCLSFSSPSQQRAAEIILKGKSRATFSAPFIGSVPPKEQPPNTHLNKSTVHLK